MGGRVEPGHERKCSQGIKFFAPKNSCAEVLPRLAQAGLRDKPGAL
jgi:hypothetical protein